MMKERIHLFFSVGLMAMMFLSTLLVGCDFSGHGSSMFITSVPDRAQVFVNGVDQGETPLTISGLEAEDYMIELRKPEYTRTYKSVSLLEKQMLQLHLEMPKVMGLLLVESNPSGAEVLIGEVSKGVTPALLTDLPLGSYMLEFRSMSLIPRSVQVELLDRTPVHVFAELKSNTATLKVFSKPEGAEVRIDGNLIGETPLSADGIAAGTSEVRISKRGYRPDARKLVFEAAKPYQIDSVLEALPSGLTVITSPEGANVLIDKQLVGVTPLNRTGLTEGVHTIEVTMEGYASQSKTIQLEPDTNDSAEFDLVKDSGTLVVDTEPAYVDVYVDGKLAITTPPQGGSDALSLPVRIMLKSDQEHRVQYVREGFVSVSTRVQTEIDQVVTRHEVLKRIFVYDTQIMTESEVIKCRVEYKLPNGDIYYERFPGVYSTVKAADILEVKSISIDDESNRAARRLIEQNRKATAE